MSRPRYRWQDELDGLTGGAGKAAPTPRRYAWQDELDALPNDPLVSKADVKPPLGTGWTPADAAAIAPYGEWGRDVPMRPTGGAAGGRSGAELFRRDDGAEVTMGQPRGVGIPGDERKRLTTTGTLSQRIDANIRATTGSLNDAEVAAPLPAVRYPGKAATYANVALSSAIGSMLSGVVAQKGVEGALAQYTKNPNAEPLDEDALKHAQWGGMGMGLVAQALGPAIINLGRAGMFSARVAKAAVEGTVVGSAMGAVGGRVFGAVETDAKTDLLPDVGGMILGREAMDPSWRAAAREAITGGVLGAAFGGTLHAGIEGAVGAGRAVKSGVQSGVRAVQYDRALQDMRQRPDYQNYIASAQRSHDASLFDDGPNRVEVRANDPAVTANVKPGVEPPLSDPPVTAPAVEAPPVRPIPSGPPKPVQRADGTWYQDPYPPDPLPPPESAKPAPAPPRNAPVDTESPEFNQWFQPSVVRNPEGGPQLMYHGTSQSFDGNFDPYQSQHGLFGQGSYFTDNPRTAQEYTKKGKGKNPGVYATYLQIKRPIDMDAPADVEQWKQQFPDAETFHQGGDTNESWYKAAEESLADQELPAWEGAEAMQTGLEGMGYDGITHMGGRKPGAVRHRVYIAFHPEQVRIASVQRDADGFADAPATTPPASPPPPAATAKAPKQPKQPKAPAPEFPWATMRRKEGTSSERLRPPGSEKKVTTEGLVEELERQHRQVDAAMGRSVYRFVEGEGASDTAFATIMAGTRSKGGGPSKQAKAVKNIRDAEGVIARIESELERRGVDVLEAQQARAQRLEAEEEARIEREAIQAADRPKFDPAIHNWWDDDSRAPFEAVQRDPWDEDVAELGSQALGQSATNTTVAAAVQGAPPAPPRSQAGRASLTQRVKDFVTGKGTDDSVPWSRRAISQQLADDLGLTGTLRERKVKNRRWAGVFNEKSGVARSRRLDDVGTVTHELMHSVDARWVRRGTSALPYVPPVEKAELMAIGRGMYPNAKPRLATVEGFAEYARHYVELDDARLAAFRQAFPNATAYFDREIFDGGPVTRAAFDNARQRFQTYMQAPADAKIDAQLGFNIVKPTRDWSWSRIRTRAFDDRLPWKEATEELAELRDEFPLQAPTSNFTQQPGNPARLASTAGAAERVRRWWNGDNSPKDNAYLLSRTARAASAEGEVWLRDGIALDPTLPDVRVSEGLQSIIESVPAVDQLAFVRYLTAESALERYDRYDSQGRHTPIDAGVDIKAARDNVVRERARFADAAEKVWKYRLGLLTARKEVGLLSEAAFNRILAKNTRNVPFNRVIDPNETSTVALDFGGGMTTTTSGVHRQHGSSRVIIDPIESLIRETYRTAQDIAEFRAVRAMIDDARATKFGGGVIERVPADLERNMVPAEYTAKKVLDFLGSGGATKDDISEALLSLGIDPENIDPKDFMGAWWSTRQHQNAQDRLNMVFPSVDPAHPDKIEFYQVKNPDLYAAMVHQAPAIWGDMGRLVSIPVRALRLGSTTMSTAFAARNLSRDAQQAFVYGRGRATTLPFEQFSRGVFDMVSTTFGGKGSLHYREWMSNGGPNAALLGLDNAAHRQAVADWRKSKPRKIGDTIIFPVRHPVEFLRNISDVAENATRLGESKLVYARAIKEGKSHSEAVRLGALASRDVSTDFARGGDISRGMSQFMPFFNANTQGSERFAREVFGNIVNDPQRAARVWTRGVVGITLPTIANYLYHTRNEDEGIRNAYAATPRYQRAFGWPIYFRTGPKTIRYILIPKGFDVGTFFGTVPERILEYLDGDSEGGTRRALDMAAPLVGGESLDSERTMRDSRSLDAMWEAMRQTFNPFSVPSALAGLAEWKLGESLFRKRPLVPRGLEKALPEDQAQSYTGEFSRALGKTIGASPAKIENLAGAQFGVAGRDAFSALDLGVRMLRDQAGLPALKDVRAGDDRRAGLENTPLLSAFLRPRAGLDAEPVEAFFDLHKKADALRTSYQNANAHRRAELDANPEDKMLRLSLNTSKDNSNGPPGFLRDARKQFDTLRARRAAVMANRALTPAMRRERIRDIDDEIIKYTTKVRATMRSRLAAATPSK